MNRLLYGFYHPTDEDRKYIRMALDGLAEDARKGKVDHWIKVNNNPVPLDKDGKPLSSVGKKIFSGSQNERRSRSRSAGNARKGYLYNYQREDIRNPQIFAPKSVVSGSTVHHSIPKPWNGKEQDAVYRYAKDGKQGANAAINRYLRFDDNERMTSHRYQTIAELDAMFDRAKPIEKPIRVFRGIPSNIADETEDDGSYSDKGFCSASSSIDVAIRYSDKGKSVLVMDIPAGSKAISVGDRSATPSDKEVLLPRNSKFRLKSSETIKGITYLYVELDDGKKD